MIIAAAIRKMNLSNTSIANGKMQLIRYAGIIISIPVLTGCVAVAPGAVSPGAVTTSANAAPIAAKTYTKAALSGTIQQITNYSYLNPDCTTQGVPSVRVVEAPAHGKITLEEGLGYTAFSKDNQRYECNKHKSPMIKVMYQSEAGYVGSDAAKLEAIYFDGNFRNDSFNIVVK